MTPRPVRTALATALLLAVGIAAAERAPIAGRTYTPADFARYEPRTALDMLRQVPGFVIREADQERGLGEATGNVVVNGQRISGKSNDVITELTRVPAGNVVRIEIVDGAKLDIPGLTGQVANVVTKAGGIRGQWSWKPDVRAYNPRPQVTRGDVSVSGSRGALQYTVGLANTASHSGADGGTRIDNADGSLRDTRYDRWTGEMDMPKLSTRLGWTSTDGDIANLNASVQKEFYHYREDGFRSGPGLPDRERRVREREGGHSYEIGGDYEFGVAGGRLKLIGLDRYAHTPYSQEVVTHVVDGSAPDSGSRFARDSEESEKIARAEYRWKTGASDWRVSAEGAFNRLDSASSIAVLDDGEFVGVPLPGADATVQEDRYELIGSWGHPLGATAKLQVSAGGEYSKLEQVGGGGLTRTFKRPKGSIALAWKPSDTLDVNIKLQRKVGQLNFYDFLASVNLNDGRENAGNPDLVPQQSWEFEVEATKNLGRWGTTTLRVYDHRIDDLIDIVPIGADGESPGNIDRAREYGAEWKGTWKLDPFGWQGAKLDTRWWVQQSEVRDPLTGVERRISNSLIHFWEVKLRDDIPGTSWAWGMNVNHELDALDVRLTEIGHTWEGPIWGELFVERKNFHGLTLRAAVANALGARSYRDRFVYLDRRTGPVDFHEVRDRRIGPILAFQVSGTF
ncbi:TonB-dependent receptor plug domain-containing protein [Cognatilysobacter segetis]|uniref:TonB-dependent receptor plug domain-containing protein n=1 Tax=Cognatilysobacter segetis TaxID=2492394 RepID=UPI001061438A|nr:TonB-dependent receptor [Lysobacter segetis]